MPTVATRTRAKLLARSKKIKESQHDSQAATAVLVPTQALARWLGVVALLTVVLIVLGATVRVFEAGLSCPDWPKCYGLWWPFPVDPAFGYTNFQVFLEWFHRLLAKIVGYGVLIGLAWAWWLRRLNPRPFYLLLVASYALFMQVLLGGLTVVLDNVPWSVALHLGNALIFLAVLTLAVITASRPALSKPLLVTRRIEVGLAVVTGVLFTTILVGAMVSKSYAGGVCGGLPDCVGQWWPTNDAQQQLHMAHRGLVLLTVLSIGAWYYLARRAVLPVQQSARAVVWGLGAQIVLGVTLLYSFAYYPDYYRALSVAHLAVATVLWTLVVVAWGKLWFGPKPKGVRAMPLHD